jgi:hypothetical protein
MKLLIAVLVLFSASAQAQITDDLATPSSRQGSTRQGISDDLRRGAIVDDQPQAQPDACGAEPRLGLIGYPLPSTLPAGTRVILPGQEIVHDYDPTRLNIRVRDAVVISVHCG